LEVIVQCASSVTGAPQVVSQSVSGSTITVTVNHAAAYTPTPSCLASSDLANMCDGSKKRVDQLLIGDSVACYNRANLYATGGSAEASCCSVAVFVHSDQTTQHAMITLTFQYPSGSSGSISATHDHLLFVVNPSAVPALPVADFASMNFDVATTQNFGSVGAGSVLYVRQPSGLINYATVTNVEATADYFMDFIPTGGDVVVINDILASPHVQFPGYESSISHDVERFATSLLWAFPLGGRTVQPVGSALPATLSPTQVNKLNPNYSKYNSYVSTSLTALGYTTPTWLNQPQVFVIHQNLQLNLVYPNGPAFQLPTLAAEEASQNAEIAAVNALGRR